MNYCPKNEEKYNYNENEEKTCCCDNCTREESLTPYGTLMCPYCLSKNISYELRMCYDCGRTW